MADSATVRWFLDAAATGIITFATPRLLIAGGVPLDKWVEAVGLALKVRLNRQVAIWAATVIFGAILYGISIAITREQVWALQFLELLTVLATPQYVIAIGLAVAAGGLVWQWRYPAADPAIATMQNEIEGLKRIVSQAPNVQARSDVQSKAAVPKYTERDIRELSDLMADANQLLSKIILPAIIKVTSDSANWRGVIPNRGVKGSGAHFRELQERLQSDVWRPLNKFVYEDHADYKEQLRSALLMNHEALKGEVGRSLQTATIDLEKLPENPSETTIELVAPQFKTAYQQAEFLYQWAVHAQQRVNQIRENLRTRGVTGFETANAP